MSATFGQSHKVEGSQGVETLEGVIETIFEVLHDKPWHDEMLTSLRSAKFFLKHKLKSHVGNFEVISVLNFGYLIDGSFQGGVLASASYIVPNGLYHMQTKSSSRRLTALITSMTKVGECSIENCSRMLLKHCHYFSVCPHCKSLKFVLDGLRQAIASLPEDAMEETRKNLLVHDFDRAAADVQKWRNHIIRQALLCLLEGAWNFV